MITCSILDIGIMNRATEAVKRETRKLERYKVGNYGKTKVRSVKFHWPSNTIKTSVTSTSKQVTTVKTPVYPTVKKCIKVPIPFSNKKVKKCINTTDFNASPEWKTTRFTTYKVDCKIDSNFKIGEVGIGTHNHSCETIAGFDVAVKPDIYSRVTNGEFPTLSEIMSSVSISNDIYYKMS